MKNTDSYKSFLKSPYYSTKVSSYFHSYDHFFSKYRHKEITFVEIGVLGGGSLFMWRDYFGPKARIIGVDLNPNAKKWEDEGFEIFIGSQSDENFLNDISKEIGGIDVLLDDGGHTYEQQIITTECLLDSINDGGILIVEDTCTSYMDGFGPKNKSFMEYVKNRIDAVNLRFGKFSDKPSEKRFWSIEISESMVAFKVDKEASQQISEVVGNGGKYDLSSDFRYADNFAVQMFEKMQRNFMYLKYVPLVKKAARYLKNTIANRKFSANKYFK